MPCRSAGLYSGLRLQTPRIAYVCGAGLFLRDTAHVRSASLLLRDEQHVARIRCPRNSRNHEAVLQLVGQVLAAVDRDVRLAVKELLLNAADKEALAADRCQRVDTVPVALRRHLDNLDRSARLLEALLHHEGLNHREAAPPCCQSNCSHFFNSFQKNRRPSRVQPVENACPGGCLSHSQLY